jgi:hypothetical protein
MNMRKRNDEPTELCKTRREQLQAALAGIVREICALDMQCAVVLYDSQLQEEDTTKLFYAGNVSIEAGRAMLEAYLEMAKSPKAKVTMSDLPDTAHAPVLLN